jgi:hypothetical protein
VTANKWWTGMALCVCAGGALSDGVVQKRMIGHGWDLLSVRPVDVARNVDAWSQCRWTAFSLAVYEGHAGRRQDRLRVCHETIRRGIGLGSPRTCRRFARARRAPLPTTS